MKLIGTIAISNSSQLNVLTTAGSFDDSAHVHHQNKTNRRSQTIYHRINKVEKTPSKRGDISNCISGTVVEPTCHLSPQLSYNTHKSVPQMALLLPLRRTRVLRITCSNNSNDLCTCDPTRIDQLEGGLWDNMDSTAGLSEYELRRLKRIEENKSKVRIILCWCAVVAGYRVSTWSHQTWKVNLHLTHQLQNFVFIMIYLQSEVQLFKSMKYCRFVCVESIANG